MEKLPKRFPEYSLMYKTILKRVQELENIKNKVQHNQKKDMEQKIRYYRSELNKIRKMFPDKFFEEIC